MGQRLRGKVAVVTGAGRGIGRAIALGLAAEGAKVVVNDLGTAINGSGSSATPADEVVREITISGGAAIANCDSVATMEGGQRIIRAAVDNFGRIDILVNNAGVMRDSPLTEMTEEDWDAVMKVHLYGHFHCIKFACFYMKQQGNGRIINISSINALGIGRYSPLGAVGRANYAAAKAGILGLTRTIAREMAPYGVTCNAIFPTAFTRLAAAASEKRQARGVTDLWEGGQKGPFPEDVAPLVVYLATDEAASINGCTLAITGSRIDLYSDPVVKGTLYRPTRWTVDELASAMPPWQQTW